MTVFTWITVAFLVIISVICNSEAYKILVAFPYPMPSHNILGKGIVRHLLKAGHEVTYITAFPVSNPQQRLRQVDVSSILTDYPGKPINVQQKLNKEMDYDQHFINIGVLMMTNMTMLNGNVINLLNDPKEQFDVVIADWVWGEVLSGLAAVFSCPYVWVYPYEIDAIGLSLIDEPTLIPQTSLSFLQRVKKLYNHITTVTLKLYYYSAFERDVYEIIFKPVLEKRGRILPPYDVMKYNASLMLGCSHVTLGQTIRLPQNYKDIGGHYIDEQVKPLPEVLQKLMDEAQHGVIYFSLGSNLKSKDLPSVIKANLLKVFAGMKQTVLWKLEEDFENVPKNVHMIKWAPQQSILAHKNCKLFISHGGLLSLTEAVHFGVPIIGIPVFVDQFSNVDRAVAKGFAKRVDLTYDLAQDLKEAVDELLRDTRYNAKVKQLSSAYHDRLLGPGPELVHWVEHVVRTRGAPHLRSPALHVPLYQKLYLDLAATLLLILLLLRVVLKKSCRFCSNVSLDKSLNKKNN